MTGEMEMNGLDYAGLLAMDKESSLRGKYFQLHLGPWELRGMPFVTIATLAEDRALLHEIVGRCFVNRPVLWDDIEGERAQHCRRALRDLSSLLSELESRLTLAPHSRDLIYKGIVTRWLEATTEVVEELEALPQSKEEQDEEARRLVAAYRTRIYGPVSALIQLLPEDDEWAEEARAMYGKGRETLARREEIPVETLEEASWHLVHPAAAEGEAMEDEESLVTWGIP
jgi:hypothetical protein